MPRSVLVLPAVNDTPDVTASDAYMHTFVRPLVNEGYYIFPPAVVDRLMKSQGVTTPADMHGVSIRKLREVFGCDAVLYPRITNWETQYIGIVSQTVVAVDFRLLDAKTGKTLWRGKGQAIDQSGGSGNLIGDAIGAAVHKVISEAADTRPGLAIRANHLICQDDRRGLLLGPLHPDFEKDQRRRREDQKTLEEMRAKDK